MRRTAPTRAGAARSRLPRAVFRAGRSVRLDLDLARRGLGPLGNHDLEHAMLAGRADLLGIGRVGQREAAIEHAVGALDARVLVGLAGALLPALALDGEDALVHVDLDLVGIDARDVGLDQEARRLLLDVHARRPLAGHHVGLVARVPFAEEAVEDVPELFVKMLARA